MSAYKQFLPTDVIITPFEVNKQFILTGSSMTSSNIGMDFFTGINSIGDTFYPSEPKTGLITPQYQSNVYSSIKQLYYVNKIPNSDNLYFPKVPYGFYSTYSLNNHRYDNYPQSTITESRYFPSGSGDELSVISIPSKLFGNTVVPNTFAFTFGTSSVVDDGEGNLIVPDPTTATLYGKAKYGIDVYGDSGDQNRVVGNIIYAHGIAILTSGSLTGVSNTISSSNKLESASISFSSSIYLFETQYKCTIAEDEFNFSLNPSLITGSNVIYTGSALSASISKYSATFNFVTQSYFSPYVTTVGLYNEMQELVAVGKLGQPLQTSRTTDTTILINFDK